MLKEENKESHAQLIDGAGRAEYELGRDGKCYVSCDAQMHA